MSVPDIVLDTNVVMSALRSKRGASYKLLSLIGTDQFEIHDSVALILEYEDVILRHREAVGLSTEEVSIFIDSLCSMAQHHKIYFQWRPFLSDPNDELVLELAVAAQCEYIVTHNIGDFKGCDKFGIQAITPKEFLVILREEKK
ncbi:putative toxin-antitoxin system toxin component, PIN family [Chlorobium sp. KB01]|uniref:putative toxin-antitoxin system toxin component, PIN family n=1 Tax=Chlorobium sp. KB01 TaxID=1917528 RepID=UPI0009789A1B|nr:putative toxin-antitoxin system toxin component, PIN family [Chlorobium sp. KB01]